MADRRAGSYGARQGGRVRDAWEIAREGKAPSARGAVGDGSHGPRPFLLFFSRVNAGANWKEGMASSSAPLPLIHDVGETSGSSSKFLLGLVPY